MKKSKVKGDVAVVMETMGVCTRRRAKTLAAAAAKVADEDDASYLQLRSRRLHKPSLLVTKQQKPSTPNSKDHVDDNYCHSHCEPQPQHSFGESNLDFHARDSDRSTRESTPCSLIRDSDCIGTPGSTTKRTTDQSVRNNIQRNFPTRQEMEEFFRSAELQQQRIFMEKYNFDAVNERPLPGRYEWMRIIP